MVMAKGVNVGISTIYYWIHHGKLGLSKQDLLYPRKGKALKKQASTTADNGTEFNRLSDVFSKEHIYYAHPYASWERGTNENHNRLIRRWLPKGTKKMTPKEVAFIEKWINNYPKKCLNYKSPREDFLMANLNLKFSVRNKSRNRFKFCRSFKYPARRCSWC
ncbi:IS1239, transposase [Streptococcus pneumoniae]|nr:IS1239, transposase [Streptococcus pneumoniae]